MENKNFLKKTLDKYRKMWYSDNRFKRYGGIKMKKIFRIRCLEDDKTFSMGAETATEALYNMMYTLNLNNFDKNCKILKTNSGRILYIEHKNKTYAVKNT